MNNETKYVIKNNTNYFEYYILKNNNKLYFFSSIDIKNINDKEIIMRWIYNIKLGIQIIKQYNEIPSVGILSGGRKEDYGRSKNVNITIKRAYNLYKIFSIQKDIIVNNYNILIEDSILDSNFIIPPDIDSLKYIVDLLIKISSFKLFKKIIIIYDDKDIISNKKIHYF